MSGQPCKSVVGSLPKAIHSGCSNGTFLPLVEFICRLQEELNMRSEARTPSLIHWSAPVHVRVGHGSSESIFGPEAAVEYLKYRWPARSNQHYLNAMRACTAATDRSESPDFARDAFIAACIEANMLA